MTTQFGWTDSIYAMTSCFSCHAASSSTDSLHNHAQIPSISDPNKNTNKTRTRTRTGVSRSNASLPEGLRPLLMNDSTDDECADALSLHSNVGGSSSSGRNDRPRRSRRSRVGSGSEIDAKKKKRDRSNGWFTFFGYDLFGKKKPAIQLPLTDDEADSGEEGEEHRRRVMRLSRNGSGATLDSDAAPLDDEAIAAAVRQSRELEAMEAIKGVQSSRGAVEGGSVITGQEVADKEERRRRRKERKERKALERALSSGLSGISSFNPDGSEFEGFQGSGDGDKASLVALKSPPPERTSYTSSKRDGSSGSGVLDEEEADFDGSTYTRSLTVSGPAALASEVTSTTTRSSGSTGRRRSRGHSQTPSRTLSNTTSSHEADQFHEDMVDAGAFREAGTGETGGKKKKKSTTRHKPSPLASSSIATSSQAPSLPSPTGSTALGSGLSISLSMPTSTSQTGSPPQAAHSNSAKQNTSKPAALGGFGIDGTSVLPQEPTFHVPVDENGSDKNQRGFPSVGFGRRNSTLSNGAFLARRGD